MVRFHGGLDGCYETSERVSYGDEKAPLVTKGEHSLMSASGPGQVTETHSTIVVEPPDTH